MSARRLAHTATIAVCVVGALITSPLHGDLRGPLDVTRALDALTDQEDAARRMRAASWLGDHGADETVVPALLAALDDEEDPAVVVSLAAAVARRARPEDAAQVLELEPRLRAPGRALLMVLLAQLGTEETDVWLVQRLASPVGSDLRAAFEQLGEIARQRRDALMSRVLDALATTQSPLLLAWLVSLEDERARGALLTFARGPAPMRDTALEGLGTLGPDAATAVALRELAAVTPGGIPVAAFARALVAAEPSGEVSALLQGAPELRAATLDALTRLSPTRAIEVVGDDPRRFDAADRHVLSVARAFPSPALIPWSIFEMRDEALAASTREVALDALVRAPACETTLDGVSLETETLHLAEARLARRCPGREVELGDDPEGLQLQAIAGRDVRAIIAARFSSAPAPTRLALAHAWLASLETDATLLRALDLEVDPDVFAVLAAAATVHGLRSDPRRWLARIEARATRRAALGLLRAPEERPPSAGLSPEVAAVVERCLRDADPAVVAAALLAAHALGMSVEPHACARLEHPLEAVARAAWAVLDSEAQCVRRRARTASTVRTWSVERAATAEHPPEVRGDVVLRMASRSGASLPRVSLMADDGTWLVVRPPAHGVLAVPGLGPARAIPRLDEEPEVSADELR